MARITIRVSAWRRETSRAAYGPADHANEPLWRVGEQGRCRLDRERFREVVSLGQVASHLLEQDELLGALYSLRGSLHVQGVSQVYNQLHDRGVLGVLPQSRYERLVDLEVIERERPECAKRGIALAEVVDSQQHTESLQILEQPRRILQILGNHGLCDLQLEAGRLQTRVPQDLLDRTHEV